MLAARFADEFNVGFAPVGTTGTQIARVRAACENIGRDPSAIVYSVVQLVCLGADPTTLERRLAATRGKADEILISGLSGPPSQIADKLDAFAHVGVSRVYLQLLDLSDLDHLAELGELNDLVADV